MASSKTIVLITGCSKGGIGFSLCEAFASKGCIVYATSRKLESMDGFSSDKIHKLALDVTKEEQIRAAVAIVVEAEGQIDILVNNAGISGKGTLIDVPMESWVHIYETNVFSIVRMSKAVIPHMAARKRGMIVNVGSITGQIPAPFMGVYSSTKAAVHSITDTLYMECAPLKIDVVLLAPGVVRSTIGRKMVSNVPDTTGLYSDYAQSKTIFMSAAFGTVPMETDTFAEKVVGVLLRPRVPRYLTLAPLAKRWRFLEWLPREWALRYLWRVLGESPRKIVGK